MKIILSPSKTMDIRRIEFLKPLDISDQNKTQRILKILQEMNPQELGNTLSIKGDLLNQTYDMYQWYESSESGNAFPSFNGLVFKQLSMTEYTQREWSYIQDHVRILDALYGMLEPGTLIKQYRLDMKANLNVNLYKYWDISSEFEGELIINLASKEFSSMLAKPMITIQFLEYKNGKYVNQATYTKMARGKMLQYMIVNHVQSLQEIKNFHDENYQFRADLSDQNTITFVR